MKVFVSNSYGGDICSIKFERDAEECFGYAVKVLGFIETNKVKIQHVSSQGRFVTDEIRFKVPHSIIPTYTSKNFRVWYECECARIFKDTKTPFSFVFEIANNNFSDFHYSSPFELDLSLVDEEDYLRKKEDVCKLLLSRIETPLSPRNLFADIAKDAKEKQEIPIVQSQDCSGNTLSFIQRKETVFSTDASSPEQSPVDLDTRAQTQSSTELDRDQAASEPDSVSVLKDQHGGEPTYSCGSDAKHCSPDPPKAAVEKASEPSYHSTPSKGLEAAVDESDVFSREVNEEIQSLVAQFAAEDALKDAKNLREDEKEPSEASYEELIQRMFEEKCRLEAEFNSKLRAIEATIRVPSFRDPNLLEIRSYESTSVVVDAGSTIAHVIYPMFMKWRSYIKIKYLRNVRNTQVNIWRQDYEKDSMIDAECIFCVSFDSDSCLEKVFEFDVQGFSLKNFVFEVRYTLSISLDGSEISLPINVLSPSSKACVGQVDV